MWTFVALLLADYDIDKDNILKPTERQKLEGGRTLLEM